MSGVVGREKDPILGESSHSAIIINWLIKHLKIVETPWRTTHLLGYRTSRSFSDANVERVRSSGIKVDPSLCENYRILVH